MNKWQQVADERLGMRFDLFMRASRPDAPPKDWTQAIWACSDPERERTRVELRRRMAAGREQALRVLAALDEGERLHPDPEPRPDQESEGWPRSLESPPRVGQTAAEAEDLAEPARQEPSS